MIKGWLFWTQAIPATICGQNGRIQSTAFVIRSDWRVGDRAFSTSPFVNFVNFVRGSSYRPIAKQV